jgi:flagellar hook-associated protein 3 FlgL
MTQVNTRAAHGAAVSRMSRLSAEIDALQGQISLGKRVLKADDDPVAFTRAAVLRRAEVAAESTRRGIDAAARRLTATDNALEGISNLVMRARELALQGSNGTLGPADRALLAREVTELSEQFAGLADARGSDGERLFGGAAAAGPAYALDANGVMVWQGGGKAPAVAVGGAEVVGGITGPEAFGTTDAASGARDLFATLSALAAALEEPDRMAREPAMQSALTSLDAHVNQLADARATAGARLARLEAEGERLAKATLANEGDLSRLESLDMAEAIARLNRLMTVLKAAQGSFVATTNLSLWDQLR